MKNWELRKLGHVCEFIGGSQPPKSDFCYEEKDNYIRLIQIRDYKSDSHIVYIPKNKAKRFCTATDIMIGRYGPPVFQILKGLDGAYNVALMKAVPNEKILSKDYAYLFLKYSQIQDYIIHLSQRAAGQTGVNKEAIEEYPILIPPLTEQQRIVSILDEAFAAIAQAKANAEQNLKNTKELFMSYLQGMFEGRGYNQVKLSEFATDITDGDHMPPPKTEEGIPFITISNINKSTYQIDFSDTFTVSPEYYQKLKANKTPQKGDILYTVTGSFGIPVLILENTKFCFQRHIGLIRPKKDVSSKWLFYWIQSPQAIQQANETATGTAQRTVSLKALRNFSVPDMSASQQAAVVQKLDIISVQTKKLESIYQKKIADLEELKKSLLEKAFKGELALETESV